MAQLLKKLAHYPDRLDALYTLLSVIRDPARGFSLLRSSKMDLHLQGKLRIARGARLYAGALSNRVQLDTRGRGMLNIYKNGTLDIKGSVRFSRTCKVYINGNLSIGDKTYVQANTLIVANSQVDIGEGCAISWNCQILDDDLHSSPLLPNTPQCKPISIGDNVWIGANVILLKGVKIGANSIVGAGSVVTESFPPGCLISGNPAKLKYSLPLTEPQRG